MAVTGCQEDLPEKVAQGITPKSGTGSNLMTEQQIADAKDMYYNQMSKVTKTIDFTFDGTGILLLPDRYGKRQYTFMVHHPDDSELVFHNVVITDWDGYKKTMLVKYEMDEEFAERFFTGLAGFDNFTGNVTYVPLTADEGNPCGENPGGTIPINNGNGPGDNNGGGSAPSGGYYGIGSPWDPNGNGNPHNEDAVNTRYLWMTLAYLDSKFNNPTEYIFDRPIYSKSGVATIPAIDDTTNPCGEGDDIGILVPRFFDIKIDPVFWVNYNCQAKVVIDAYSASSDLNNIFLSIFEGSDQYNVTYKTANTIPPDNPNAGTSYINETINPDGTKTHNFEVVFLNDYLNTATDLSIAATAIHENLHAILIYLRVNGTVSTTTINPSYQELLDAYIAKLIQLGNVPFMPTTNNIHHDFMAQFVGDMADALKAYGLSKGYFLPDSYYEAMAWKGLLETPAFLALYPELDSNGNPNPNYTYIVGTIETEQNNHTQMDDLGNNLVDLNGNQIIPRGTACP